MECEMTRASCGLIAIDQGLKGGIAFSDPEYGVCAVPMPDGIDGIWTLLSETARSLRQAGAGKVYAAVEQVGYHRAGNNAQASATFARHCGHIDMALHAAGISILNPVPPTRWEKWLGNLPTAPTGASIESRARFKRERKRAVRDRMAVRFPHIRVTLQTADALAMWLYAQARLAPQAQEAAR